MEPSQARRLLNASRARRPLSVECVHALNPQVDLMIVIPAYQAESYVQACLDSVLSQKTRYTYQVVVVDDGSTDRTAKILNTYAQDQRVRVIHQENGGISRARNAGLQILTGRYVMFVDADDVLRQGAIQRLLSKAYSLDADIIEGGWLTFEDNKETRISKETVISTFRYADSEEPADFTDHHGVPWGKVFRAEMFEHLQFPEDYEYEDSIMGYCLFPATQKKYTIRPIVYGYRKNPNSITYTASKTEKCLDTFYLSLYLWDWYAQHFTISEAFRQQVLRQMALNHRRTAQQGEIVQRCGMCLQRESYLQLFAGRPGLSGQTSQKYEWLDTAIRSGNWGQYALLCERWSYLK